MEIIFYSSLLLHAFIFLRTALVYFSSQNKPSISNQPPVSIIISAHNELHNLRRLIPNLLIQNYPAFEVVIALDRCDDGSIDYVKGLANPRLKWVEISEVPQGWNGKKYALNEAIGVTQNDWLLLTDADCMPASTLWIQSFAKQMNDETDLILSIGAYQTEKHLISQITNYETFQTAFHYIAAALNGSAYMGVGRNIAYYKPAFIRVGGFDGIKNLQGGDDDLLVQKLATDQNTSVSTDQKSLTYSSPERTWKKYIRQKTRHLSVGKHYSSKFKLEHTVRSLAHATLWMSFLYLLMFYPDPFRIISLFGLLLVVKGVFFRKISNKLGLSFQMFSYPVLDLVYAIFLPLLGVRASIVKKIPWK